MRPTRGEIKALDSCQPITLAEATAAGATVVTVNNRLARYLLARDDAEQAAKGPGVWPTPQILPLNAWLHERINDALDQGLLDRVPLSAPQERLVWEQVIRSRADARELLQPAAAARAAQRALGLCHDWLLEEAELRRWAGPETETFLAWRRAFERRCRDQGWFSGSESTGRLARLIRAGDMDVPGPLVLAGFDEFNPALQQMLSGLAARGCRPRLLVPPPGPPVTVRRCVADEPEHELRLAAHWARARLQAVPTARVGIVAPDLQDRHRRLRRIFTEVLHPDAPWRSGGDPDPQFNLSLGLPLSDFPVVRDALLALRLSGGPHPHAEYAALLRSPYLGGGQSEHAARAELDARLRRDGRPVLDRQRLSARAAVGRASCPDLRQRLTNIGERLAECGAKASSSTWAPRLLALLGDWGWPGERRLDSREFQQAGRFRRLIDEFAALDGVLPRLGFDRAVQQLERLAAESLYQPESGDAPIQVLGILEAGGQRFDHLWLLGLDDQTWPAAAAPDPLLPAGLQHRLGMPHASARRELDFADRVTGQLLQSGGEVVVSHARRDADRELGPSPLIAHLVPAEPPVSSGAEAVAGPVTADTAIEAVGDLVAPPSAERLGGGTDLLASQSACPFRAVAGHRLQARPLEEISHAPDPAMLGDQVHRILAAIWQGLGDQAALLALGAEALRARVQTAVESVLNEARHDRPDLYPPAFAVLERDRLMELIESWLAFERDRPPFRVERIEQREEIELGGLRLRVRADRIDQTELGELIVIDYKTGAGARVPDWLGERIGEPQVPLYASHLHQTGRAVGAAVIARVRIDDRAGFAGLSHRDGQLPGVKTFRTDDRHPDWATLLEHWHRGLLSLAAEIGAGRADPTPSPEVCRYCPYPSLCRVAELIEEDGDV